MSMVAKALPHIIAAQQFDQAFLENLFLRAEKLEMSLSQCMQGKRLATIFYEPSTRTRLSFEAAALGLGGGVISTENAGEFSSAVKGESLKDSVRIISGYADVIVLRHPEDKAAEEAAEVAEVPVINAGSGREQHPTQALLDLYTIKKECGGIDGVTVAMVGDLRNGRTIRSLAYLLGKYAGIKIFFVSAKALQVGDDIKEYLARHGIQYEEAGRLEDVIDKVDVLYQTRVQKERLASGLDYEHLKTALRVDRAMAERMRKGAIIMHPLPRVGEIDEEVDSLPQAAYFRQAKNGLYVRMALLQWIFER